VGSDGSGERKKKRETVPQSRVKKEEVKMTDRGRVKPRSGRFLRTMFVLHFILFSSRD
jgi:hypothetical protein